MIGRPPPSTGRLTASARAHKNKSRKSSPTPIISAEDSDAYVDVVSISSGNTDLESQDYDLDSEDDDIFGSEDDNTNSSQDDDMNHSQDDDMNHSQDEYHEMDGEDRGSISRSQSTLALTDGEESDT